MTVEGSNRLTMQIFAKIPDIPDSCYNIQLATRATIRGQFLSDTSYELMMEAIPI